MIVVDTSALMAIVLGETTSQQCADALFADSDLLIAAPTVTECIVVSSGRKVDRAMTELLADLCPLIVPLTAERAAAAGAAYRVWGKGFHPAKLNLGDSFAYALAIEHDCPLLFVGNDFARTDVAAAR